MPDQGRSGKAREHVVAVFECVAAVFLAATMLLTIADVALRTIDAQWRIYGVVEMVQLTFDCLVFLALPAVFLLARNITVNVFDDLLPSRALRVLVTGAALTTMIYLVIVGWQIIVTALEALEFDDQTQDLEIPLFVYWLPIWIGIGGALVAEAVALVTGPRLVAETEDMTGRALE